MRPSRLSRIPAGIKQTLLYGVSIALMKGISLLMLPIITYHLSTHEVGRLEVISSLAVLGSVLVGMGLEDTLYRLVGASKNPAQRRRLAGEILSLAVLIGMIALIAGYLSADWLAMWMPGGPSTYEVRLVLAMLALEGCIAIPLGWLRMNDRVFTFVVLTTGRALLHAALVLILLNAGRGVAGVLEAGLISAVIQGLIAAYLHIRDTGLALSHRTARRCLVYSLPIVASGLVAFALNGIDRWILAGHAGLHDVAQFGVAAKFALAVVLLIQPFGMWWSPRRFEVMHEPNGHAKVARFIAFGMVLTLIVTVLIGLASPLLIDWLLPDNYGDAGKYVMGLVLVMAFKEMAELVNLGCFTGKTTYTQLFINVAAAVIGITSMLWWAPEHAVWGVIFALLTAQGIRLVLFFLASQHFLPLPYPAGSLAALILLGIAWLLIGHQTASNIQLLLTALIATCCLSTMAMLLKLIPPIPVRSLS